MANVLEHSRKKIPGRNGKHRPTWEIAHLYPPQGQWTEDDYFDFEESCGNILVELNDGFLEFPPMPNFFHQDIVEFLFYAFKMYLKEHKFGRAYFAPLPIRLWPGQIREPDIAIFKHHRIKDKHAAPNGADLALEVVSQGTEARKRDTKVKRRVYAKAGIAEYWIVDPQTKTITVLTLVGKSYKKHGIFKNSHIATSKLLKGFEVAVRDVFAAGEAK